MCARLATLSVNVMVHNQHRVAFLLLLVAVGCRAADPVPERRVKDDPAEAVLRVRLREFGHTFASQVERAADDVAAQTTDPQVRRNSVHLKMRTIPLCRRMASLPNTRVALASTWLLCAGLAAFFERDEELFGEETPIAQAVFRKLEQAIEAVCAANLSAQELEQARERIEAFSLVAMEVGATAEPLAGDKRLESAIGNLVGKPVSFFQSSFQKINPTGLNETALAIQNASATLEQTTNVIDYLPEDVRWQTELLVYQIENTPTVVSAIDSMARLSDASVDVARTAANLPANLRAELSTFVADVDQHQSGLQTTLREARATIEELDGSLERVETLVASVGPTADAISAMGKSLEGAIGEFKATVEVLKGPEPPAGREPEPAEEEKPGKPFDINDYARTAESLTETARALSTVLEQFRHLTTTEQTAPVLDALDATTRRTVDHLTLRAVQLTGAILAAAVVYRLLSVRLTRRSIEPG